MSAATRWGRQALAAWPRQCEICHNWSSEAVCPACVTLFAPPQFRCPRCALPSPEARLCGRCLHRPPAFDRTVAAVDYTFPWDGLVSRFKFRDQPELAACLLPHLQAAVHRADLPMPDLLLPIPLSAQRLRERGYNQAWELARRLGARLGLASHAGTLLRGRDTAHQVGLDRAARTANLRDSLWVEPAAMSRISGRSVALVDDVMTTGATAEAAAQALRRAGAAQVQVWVFARTPLTD